MNHYKVQMLIDKDWVNFTLCDHMHNFTHMEAHTNQKVAESMHPNEKFRVVKIVNKKLNEKSQKQPPKMHEHVITPKVCPKHNHSIIQKLTDGSTLILAEKLSHQDAHKNLYRLERERPFAHLEVVKA